MTVDLTDLYSKKIFLYEIDHYNPDKKQAGLTDISFDNTDNSINGTITDLSVYNIYDKLTVSGSASNDGTYTILTVSATKLTVSEAITTEAAGSTIELTAVETLRLSTVKGFITEPGDNPANVFYEGRISQDLNSFFNRNLYRQRATFGSSDSSFGNIVINNLDSKLDFLRTHSFNGRDIVIKIGDEESAFTDYLTILTGTMSRAVFAYESISIIIRDRSFILDNLIQDVRFEGTNSGATGNEGLPGDIQGQHKPLCYGECKNIPLIPVNTTAYRYQFHAEGVVNSVDAVYDSGIQLTLTTDYTVDLANGIIDLIASPSGQVTADVKGDAIGGYVDSVSDIVSRILTTHTDLTSSDLDTASFTALNSLNNSTVGIYITGETTVRQVIDPLLNSIGAFGGFDRDGIYTVGRFEEASGTAVKDFVTDEILSLQLVDQSDDTVIPPYQIKLNYQRNFLVQSSGDLASNVTDDRRAYLALEYRSVTATDESVITEHLLSDTLEKNSLLINESDANTESDRLLTLYKEKRYIYQLTVKAEALSLDLNDVISITYKLINPDGSFKDYKFGLNQTLCRIIGINEDTLNNIYNLTVFV